MVAAVYYIMSATVIIIIRSEGGYSASRKYRVLLLKLAPHSQNFDTVNKLLGSSLEVMSSQYFSERERERERNDERRKVSKGYDVSQRIDRGLSIAQRDF